MIDEEEDTGGKIDWTIAIVLSVAFHAAILGAVLLLRIRREIRRREAKKAEKTAQEA